MSPWTLREYPLDVYPFDSIVARALDEDDLAALTFDGPLWKEREDQRSPWHARFYATFPDWAGVYRRFVRAVVSAWMGEPFYLQAVPTFRVHLPGNVAVGTFHTDATYHHPEGEVTFWLPLTRAEDTSSVWIADERNRLCAPSVLPGDVVEFSAVTQRHGNLVNETGKSRVSFDFRCIPVRMLPNVEGPPSENMRLRFVPGGYYADEIVTP